MMRRGLLAPLVLLGLAACVGWRSQRLAGRAVRSAGRSKPRSLRSTRTQSSFCNLVQRAIDAGGMTYPLAYSVDVLERYSDEHC